MIELYDSSSSDSKDYYFISKPEESLNKIAKFLEFRVEQRMIDFIYNSYINEKYESSVNEFKYMKSISTILDSWKEQLSSKSKLLIKNILREELLFYGYDEKMKEDILHNTIRFNVIGSDLRVMKFLFTNAQLCYLLNNFINDNLVPHSYKYVNIYNPALSIYYKNMNYYVAEGKEKHPAVDINWWGLIKLHLFLEADC